MSALLDLAARVEALNGPDGATDSAIVLALWPVVRIPSSAMFEPRQDGWHDPKGVLPGPWNYTASLDAAMTLVPEGMQWSVDSHYKMAGVWRYWDDPQHGPCCEEYAGEAATLALALTAAALKARGAAQ